MKYFPHHAGPAITASTTMLAKVATEVEEDATSSLLLVLMFVIMEGQDWAACTLKQ